MFKILKILNKYKNYTKEKIRCRIVFQYNICHVFNGDVSPLAWIFREYIYIINNNIYYKLHSYFYREKLESFTEDKLIK